MLVLPEAGLAPRRGARSGGQTMKLKILIGALLWTALVSALHVRMNIGTAALVSGIRVILGLERQQLYVGFLPVT